MTRPTRRKCQRCPNDAEHGGFLCYVCDAAQRQRYAEAFPIFLVIVGVAITGVTAFWGWTL